MPRINRRHFLHFAGSTLTALGLSQLDIIHQVNRYSQVLAQSTPRKLALLIGINSYQTGIPSLKGCLTDVQMQRELLLHRFGFNPQDIVTLTDKNANRQNILDTFENHLIKQAKPGDVVVFHFSGYGSQVDTNSINKDGLDGTIIPYNRYSQNTRNTEKVRDITGKTLFLLMYALQTENVTAVLDSCYSRGGRRGNLLVRAFEDTRIGNGNAQASPDEFEYQNKLLSRLNLSPSKFRELRRKGIALGSVQRNLLALDVPFDGFHAGGFSYLLTRYLWQQSTNQSVETTFVNLQRSTQDVAKSNNVVQVPQLEVNSGSPTQQPLYFLQPAIKTAEGVIRTIKNEKIEFWLGGVSSENLEFFTKGAIFNLIDGRGQVLAELEQTSRNGIIGYGKILRGERAAIQPGGLLREKIRSIPKNLTLQIGLDASLGNETDIARQKLEEIYRVEPVVVNQQQVANFILGTMTSEYLKLVQKGVNIPIGSIGLFSNGLTPIPHTFTERRYSETNNEKKLSLAIKELRSHFKMLLESRIIRSVINQNTSSLKFTAEIIPNGTRENSITITSRGAIESGIVTQKINTTLQPLKPGTEIKVHLNNQESRNLYIAVLAIDSKGKINLLYPSNYDSAEYVPLIAPGKELVVPPINSRNYSKFIVRGSSGFLELIILASTKPFRNTLQGIKQVGTAKGTSLLFTDYDSLSKVESLIEDLGNNTQTDVVGSDSIAIDTNQLAALSTTIKII